MGVPMSFYEPKNILLYYCGHCLPFIRLSAEDKMKAARKKEKKKSGKGVLQTDLLVNAQFEDMMQNIQQSDEEMRTVLCQDSKTI